MSLLNSTINLSQPLQGLVSIEIRLEDGVSEQEIDFLEKTVEDKIKLANLGAFVDELHHPSDASFTIQDVVKSPSMINIMCVARNIDCRWVYLLRNSLIVISLERKIIQHFMVRGEMDFNYYKGDLPELNRKMAEIFFPAITQYLNFAVEKENPVDYRSPRRVEIEFTQELTINSFKTMSSWIQLWGRGVFDAYAYDDDDLISADAAIVDVASDIADDFTAEIMISRFGAPQVAWNSLLNLIARIDNEVLPVSIVRIQ